MSRVRLTARNKQAVEDKTPYPGNVNQDDRKFKKRDKYHTFEHTVNHELPDKRTDWKVEHTDKGRDDIGFGIPKVAKIYASAQKAVRMAVLFLGDKCEDQVIEEQARDFMRLGSTRIDSALNRFADTEQYYDNKVTVDASDDAVNEGDAPDEDNDDKVTDPNSLVKEDGSAGTVSTPETVKKESAPASGNEEAVNEGEYIQPASAQQEELQKVAEDNSEETQEIQTAEDEEEEEVVEEEVVEAEEDEEVEDVVEDEVSDVIEDEDVEEDAEEDEEEDEEEDMGMSAMDEVMDDSDEDEIEDSEEDQELASIFADDETDVSEEGDANETVTVAKKAKKAKQGVKSLGGQPTKKIASAEDLVDLWSSAPDVSDVF